MAYDLAVDFGDKREQDDSLLSQAVDQVCFVATPKSGLIHFPDQLTVSGLLISDDLPHISSFAT